MLRLGSRGCVLALLGMLLGVGVGACDKSDASGTVGSPNASAAGNEAGKPGSPGAGPNETRNADALVRSLVAVAATSPSDAQPCERTCGRVGDCLLADEDVGEFEASRLELECLDVCVHAPENEAARSAFLACDEPSGCGELLGCARLNWDALVAARSGPAVQGITTGGGDSCFDSCQWWLSCMVNGVSPDQAPLPSEYEESLRSCEMQCETSPAERDLYRNLGECARANCSPERLMACYDNL